MRLRHIEADVIELPEVFSLGQHLFAIKAKPLFKFLLPLLRQIGLSSFRDKRRNNKLGSHHPSDAQSGRKIIAAIAQFNVIAEEWNCVSDQSLQGFRLGTNLKGTSRIGGYRHIKVWHGEKGERRAARAKLNERSRLYRLRGIVNCFEEIRQSFDRVLRLCVMVRRVVAGWNSIHVLTIEL